MSIVWADDKRVLIPGKDILQGKTKEELVNSLAQILRGRVKFAYLFGSITTKKFQPAKSDVDLILIVDTQEPYFERWRAFRDILESIPRVDLLIYTPDEWERLCRQTNGFWRSVHRTKERIL